MQQKRPPRFNVGRRYVVRLPLQASAFLSLLICALHGLLFLALLLFSELPPFVYIVALLFLTLSAGLWVLRHWAMNAFRLCVSENDDALGMPKLLLQGRDQDTLILPEVHSEWQHYELIIARVDIRSELIARQMVLCGNLQARGSLMYVSQCLWAVLPTHRFRWRLILFRSLHEPEAWRLLCQRLRLLH
ncbi:hypothetical protein [Pseudoteredinibacter isoporae]|uniref:hypothetical protein n=1 Tax=Pseudoteredinibacter isoporae TaxID=570281 RepID=UPI003102D069